MNTLFTRSFLISLAFSISAATGYALEVETHKAINQYVAENSIDGFSIEFYLKNQLGFQNGASEKFNLLKVWELIRDGGAFEDAPPENTIPYRRSRNHFHDPTKTWDLAYYSGPFSFCSLGHCPESAILWAQGPQPINDVYNPGGDWSWKKIREYYYTALTGKAYGGYDIAPDKAQRDAYFARTFRGLGQLMHLVQDMSVPSHTRNDGHAFYDYEGFVEKLRSTDNATFLALISSPVTFDPSILTLPPNSLAPIPIAKIFDTDKYDGSAQLTGSDIGLAEYANANFFSEDSIDSSEFPFPSRTVSSYNICKDTAPAFSRAQKRWYLSRTACPQDAQGLVDHFLAYGLFTGLQNMVTGTQWDDRVYEDYARKLLPRAVGYSAGLLKYFFRGKLAVSPVDDNNVKVYNFSDEPLNGGIIELYYDDALDQRHWCGSFSVQSPIASGKDTGPITLVPFAPADNKKPGRYLAVFKGMLGDEEGAVIGSFGFAWREEWDNGLRGNHTWLYTDADIVNQNPQNPPIGSVSNAVVNGKLIKDNVRSAGQDWFHVNQTLIKEALTGVDPNPYCIDGSSNYCFPNDFGKEFPIPITSTTRINLKIDSMTLKNGNNQDITIPNQICGTEYFPTAAYQNIRFAFRLGDGRAITLEFTAAGHESYLLPYLRVPLGQDFSANVFSLLSSLGSVAEPVTLDGISVIQQLLNLCEPSTTEHRQHMEIDYIRILDGDTQQTP